MIDSRNTPTPTQTIESYRSLEQEAYLALLRCSAEKSRQVDELFRSFGISQPQYNVLRILNGAGPEGLGRNEIGARMLHATPDMTRLLSRMVLKGWVTRDRDGKDRRETPTHLTASGKKLLNKMDGPLAELHASQFGAFSKLELKRLVEALRKLRHSA